jgi:hypothetical protein
VRHAWSGVQGPRDWIAVSLLVAFLVTAAVAAAGALWWAVGVPRIVEVELD